MRLIYWLLVSIAGLGVNAFDLQCSSLRESSFSDQVKAKTCDVKNMTITEKGTKMTSARRIADIDRVKGLRISNQIVNFMPEFFEEIAQRLERLVIHTCQLKSIDNSDLRQFPNLIKLRLSVNDFTSLPANLFEFNEKLEAIDFHGNKLKFIEANILQPLVNLKKADFLNAECIDFDANTPAQIKTLKSELQSECKEGKEQNKTSDDYNPNDAVEEFDEQNSDQKENDQLKEKILELERKLEESQQQSSKFENDIAVLSKKLKVCDKMLNAAAKNVAPLISHDDPNSFDNQTVEIVCEDFTSEAKVCNVIDLLIENPATEITSIKDEAGSDVLPTSLIIRQQPVLFLPISLAEALPDLEELEVSGSGLFVLDRKSFKGLDKLTNLNLTSNKILKIASGSFSDLQNLTTLDLSHNNIASIEFGAFEGLYAMQLLNLNDNKLEEITAKFMSPLRSLASLNLLNNVCVALKHPETALEDIVAAVQENCTAPIAVNCASINDSHVCHPENLRVEQPNIKIWKVTGFGAGQIAADVTALHIEDQIANFLPHQFAQTFPKLQNLVVSRSELSQLTKTDFVGFSDLKWIEICDNNLTSIHPETFNAVPQLVHLDLSSNHIQLLPPKIFERLTMLVELRLSINSIKVLPADTFPKVTAMKIFRIDNNKLEEIDPKLSKTLRTFDEIDMSNNTCIDVKYEKPDDGSTKALRELFADIVINCLSDL